MQIKHLIPLAIITVFAGCANKQPLSTIEATDYAMSCQALIKEINLVRSQYENETNGNTAKNIIGGVLTLGIYSADDEKAILLRERAKSLQTIYTIKHAKGECKELNKEDLQNENKIIQGIKETKEIVKTAKDAVTE